MYGVFKFDLKKFLDNEWLTLELVYTIISYIEYKLKVIYSFRDSLVVSV